MVLSRKLQDNAQREQERLKENKHWLRSTLLIHSCSA